jgi:hypothetical protein
MARVYSVEPAVSSSLCAFVHDPNPYIPHGEILAVALLAYAVTDMQEREVVNCGERED